MAVRDARTRRLPARVDVGARMRKRARMTLRAMMGNGSRVVGVLLMVAAAAGSATAPQQHTVSRSAAVPASFDATWRAVIALFSERTWAISNMEKASGLIVTDWMNIADDSPFLDCGGQGLTSVVRTEVKFNVVVEENDRESRLVVNVAFRQLRSFDQQQRLVDCTSTGKLENVIQSEVAQRAPRVRVATKRTTDSPAAAAFFCSSAPADQTIAACARSTVGCARKQADLVDQVGDATPCQPASTAVCFTAMDAGGTTIESCHPGAASCAKQEARARADAVTLRDVTACAVAP